MAETFVPVQATTAGAGQFFSALNTAGVLAAGVPSGGATAGNLVALGGTTGATSSTTHTLSALSFEGDGGVSVGFSTTAAGAGVVVISGGGAGATSNAYFALGQTTGATSSGTAAESAISLSGAGGVSIGLSTTAAGANVIVVSGATGGGGGGGTISFTNVGKYFGMVNAGMDSASAAINMMPFSLPSALAINAIRYPGSFSSAVRPFFISDSASSVGSRAVTVAITANTFLSIYASTAYQAWSTVATASAGLSASWQVSESLSSWSQLFWLTFQTLSTTSSTTWSVSTITSNPTAAFANAASSFYTGLRQFDFPVTATLTSGYGYMLGVAATSSSASTTLAGVATRWSPPGLEVLQLQDGAAPGNYFPMGAANNAGVFLIPVGYSGYISNTLKSASFNATDMSNLASAYIPFIFSMGSFTA